MSKSRWLALAVIVLVILPVVAAMSVKRTRDFMLNLKTRMDLKAELQPVVLKNCTLKRFGSANDGGYLLCENLSEGIQSSYSYGVGPNDELGCDVSKRYDVPVHQYDCFDPARPKCEGGAFVFHDECIAPQSGREDGRVFDSLQNHIARNGDTGKRLIVKIDVEGAEWDSLLATPDTVLDQIDQMPMELHGVEERRIVEVLRKLKQHFYLVNLHFNNFSCARIRLADARSGLSGAVGEQAARDPRRVGSGAGARERTQCPRPSQHARLPALGRSPGGRLAPFD